MIWMVARALLAYLGSDLEHEEDLCYTFVLVHAVV